MAVACPRMNIMGRMEYAALVTPYEYQFGDREIR